MVSSCSRHHKIIQYSTFSIYRYDDDRIFLCDSEMILYPPGCRYGPISRFCLCSSSISCCSIKRINTLHTQFVLCSSFQKLLSSLGVVTVPLQDFLIEFLVDNEIFRLRKWLKSSCEMTQDRWTFDHSYSTNLMPNAVRVEYDLGDIVNVGLGVNSSRKCQTD
jgi:hypothetical protein